MPGIGWSLALILNKATNVFLLEQITSQRCHFWRYAFSMSQPMEWLPQGSQMSHYLDKIHSIHRGWQNGGLGKNLICREQVFFWQKIYLWSWPIQINKHDLAWLHNKFDTIWKVYDHRDLTVCWIISLNRTCDTLLTEGVQTQLHSALVS